MRGITLTLAFVLAPFLAWGEPVSVVVTIPPLGHFAEKIGGEHVSVDVLLAPGHSPATYQPTPRQVASLSSADLLFTIGVPFERSLLPKVRAMGLDVEIVDTQEGINLRPIDGHHHHNHDHDHDHHDCGGHEGAPDPHTWMDPIRVVTIAGNMADALVRHDPANAAAYRANLERFQEELRALDRQLRETLAPVRGRVFYIYHPSLGYFADAYGLEQRAVEVGGRDPSARQLAELIDRARREEVRVVFVQKQFPTRSAQALAEAIDGSVVALDPLARDYAANLRQIARSLLNAWGADGGDEAR